METIQIPSAELKSPASRICLGTWAIGGWMWGGSEEQESIRTIHTALDQGINRKFSGRNLPRRGQRSPREGHHDSSENRLSRPPHPRLHWPR